MKKSFSIYLAVLVLLNLSIFSAPLLLSLEKQSLAKPIYSLFSYLCHQYVYRSYCFSWQFPYVKSCALTNETVLLSSINGEVKEVSYNKKDVGVVRGEIVEKANERLFKFPVCSRDLGFYLSLLITALLYKRYFKEQGKPKIIYLVVALLLFVIDGGLQLLTNYEATNGFRFIDGFLAGFFASLYIIPGYFE